MREFLEDMFRAAIAAADPKVVLPPHLTAPPENGRTVVIGAGKAGASMAQALEQNWPGELEGLVITRYGHKVPCKRIEIVEAAHPVPDRAGLDAAARILDIVRGLTADDLVLCLISGGGSALLTAPAPGLTLADKQAINSALLRSGAPISEMNTVRKHLSAIKGGRLAIAAYPAKVVTLIISDVPGDDPSVVASGPTVADASTFPEALAILRKYDIGEPAAAINVLELAAEETPKPGDPRLARNEVEIIASARQALAAAGEVARSKGYCVLDLGDRIEGEARDVARDHAALVRQILTGNHAVKPPCVILSGGETSVTMKGRGRGGRNSEYLLSLAIALNGASGVYALAGDTDGIDGSEANAGAIITPDTLGKFAAAGLEPQAVLDNNDAFTAFETSGDLVVTGPTLTNVNDLRAIVISNS
jgi:glycerate 2-kinase